MRDCYKKNNSYESSSGSSVIKNYKLKLVCLNLYFKTFRFLVL